MKPVHLGWALLVLGLATACGHDYPDAPANGELALTIRTTGGLPDPDGYVVVIDESLRTRVSLNSETVVPLTVGQHVIRVEDLSENCTASAEGWVRFISSSNQAQLTIQVSCPANGTLILTTDTRGVELDSDGYLLLFQDQIREIGPQAELRLPNIRAGSYSLALRGVAGNCSIDGGPSRGVTMEEGKDKTVAFRLECTPRRIHPPGDYLVVSFRPDPNWDSDIYLLPIDGSFLERLTDDPGEYFAPTFLRPVTGSLFYGLPALILRVWSCSRWLLGRRLLSPS